MLKEGLEGAAVALKSEKITPLSEIPGWTRNGRGLVEVDGKKSCMKTGRKVAAYRLADGFAALLDEFGVAESFFKEA